MRKQININIIKKKNDFPIKNECFFKNIGNILYSLYFSKIKNEESLNKENKEEINKIINLCNTIKFDKKDQLFKEYFNNSFWINKNNIEDNLSLEILMKYNKDFDNSYNIYQKEIKFIINNNTTEE